MTKYKLINNLSEGNEFHWLCPLCELDPRQKRGISKEDVASIVSTIVANSTKQLKEDIKSDMEDMLSGLTKRVGDIEREMDKLCTTDDMRTEVKKQLDDGLQAISKTLASEIDKKVAEALQTDRERQRRKNNLIAFGVPINPSLSVEAQNTADKAFIEEFLQKEYGMLVTVTNVRRLNKRPSSASAQDPPKTTVPTVFTVNNPSLPRKIVNTSYERRNNKDAVQFRHDKVKADRDSRKLLLAELRDRVSNGELDLVIRGNKIVQKNPEAMVV